MISTERYSELLSTKASGRRCVHIPNLSSLLCKMSAKDMATPVASGSGNKPLSRPAHALIYEAVIDELQADDNAGLSLADAEERLQVYGTNDLGEGAGVQPAKILLRQVANAMTLVMCTIKSSCAVRPLIHQLVGAHPGYGCFIRHSVMD